MNDPNGTVYHEGVYHLFYQHNPYRPRWGRIHWGHARSKDLVHWEHLPIALSPEGAPEEMHCWSGCCVIAPDGTPMIFYTSVNACTLLSRASRYAQQWVATGSSDLLNWEKAPMNPILEEAIHGARVPRHWRDPYVWRESDAWYMVIAGKFPSDTGGSALLYRSPDLRQWEYLGLLCQGGPELGRGWECPNYFRLGGKHVLVVSPYQQVIYSVGEFTDHRHITEAWHILDHGKAFYATNTFQEPGGRTILVGWVKARGEKGWAGCLSLPRELRLTDDNKLWMGPIEELATLRHKHQHFEHQLDGRGETKGTASYFGECVEIQAVFELSQVDSLGFKLLDDQNEYLLALDLPSQTFLAVEERARLQFAAESGHLELHIFIDRSVIEIFINNREAFTITFKPKLAQHHHLKIIPFFINARGSVALDFWTLQSTS